MSMSDMHKDKLIYVAGYSRCGSTVLSMLLGSHREIEAVGEVCFLPDDWGDASRICTCGKPYADCDFWGGLKAKVALNENTIAMAREFESRRSYNAVRRMPADSDQAREYGQTMRAILDHAREQAGVQVILDSSKSARAAAARPLALAKFAKQDVYVIHLVRDGHATVDSYKRHGSNWAQEGYIKPPAFQVYRAMLGWRLANQYAARLQQDLGAERYLKVQYDALVTDPAQTLAQIGAFAGLDFADTLSRIERDEPFESDHQVGGNRVRFEAPRFKRKTLDALRVELPVADRAAFRLLAGRP